MPFKAMRMRHGAAAGGGGSWTPADLGATLAFWANESSSLTQSGGTASRWDDARSNGLYVEQSTGGDQPAVNATGLNSMRTLEFTSSDYMDVLPEPGSSLLTVTNAAGFLGFVAVYQNRSSSAAVRNLWCVSNNSITAIRFALQSSRTSNTDKTSLGVRRLDGDSFASLSAATALGTSWGIGGVRMDYANGDGFVDVNGVLADASNLSLTTSGNTSSTDSSRIRLCGNITNPASNFADANIAEILFLAASSKPSDSDFDKINGYLAHKWGLAGLLDSGHPYKSAPP